ncbi:MAG: RAMP superfamily CRISPR-associated protein [Candidatus Bathyarchaeia archaeon]
MNIVRHLSPLEYKVIGLLEFKIESPLNIGTGTADVRRTFARIPGDRGFIIPSSTWKGAFRSVSERIARSMDFRDKLAELAIKSFEEGLKISYKVDEKFCNEVLNVLRGGVSTIIPYSCEDLIEAAIEVGFTLEEINEIRERGFDAHSNLLYKLSESILAFHCPIGKLYGNHVLAGKLRFLDTILGLGNDGVMLHERSGVAIDRYSGRVREGALFILESIVNGKVRLIIIADNLIPGVEDSRLFALTLEAIENLGLSLGARKSTGMGWLILNSEKSYWYIIDLRNDKDGTKIGNPFKHAEKRYMKEFLKWLWS